MNSITVQNTSSNIAFMPCDFDSDLPYETEAEIMHQVYLFNQDTAWGIDAQCVAVEICNKGVFVTLRDDEGNVTREKFMHAIYIHVASYPVW